MKNLLKFVTLIFAIGIISCDNDLNENRDTSSDIKNTDLAKNYLTFFRNKSAEGSVLIQSITSTAMQEINKNISYTEKESRNYYNDKSSSSKRIEIKGFDKNSKSARIKNNAKDDNNFFGKVLSYRIADNSSSAKNSSDTSSYNEVYIPELITVSYSTGKLVSGTVITWNIDSLNKNGVVISIEYYAVNQLDTKLAFDNVNTIKKSFVIDDTIGSYTITEADLEMFPNNALLDINVLRAGFDTDNNSNLAIAGLTKVGDTKYVQR